MLQRKDLYELINNYPTINLGNSHELDYLTVLPKSDDLINLQKGRYHVLTDFFLIDDEESDETEIGIELDNEKVIKSHLLFGNDIEDYIDMLWYILHQTLYRAVNKGKKVYNFVSLQTKYDLLDHINFFFDEYEKESRKELESLNLEDLEDYNV